MASNRRITVLNNQLQAVGVSSSDEMGGYGDKMLSRGKSDSAEDAGGRPLSIWSSTAADFSKVTSLKGKTVFLAGASRGIGKAIAMTMAKDGANVVVTGKTAEPHETLPGTVYTSAADCARVGSGDALGLVMDVRDEASIKAAVDAAVARFGGIDIVVSCASGLLRFIFCVHTASLLYLVGLTKIAALFAFVRLCCARVHVSYFPAAAGRNEHEAVRLDDDYQLSGDHTRDKVLHPPLTSIGTCG
jgi:hypothetical protein